MDLSKIFLEAYSLLFEGTKTRKAAPWHYAQSNFNSILKKYSGPEYFVRYVHPWYDEKNKRSVAEVGINTKQKWGNPRGIYCYWLDDVKDDINSEFATDYEYVFILKRKSYGVQIEDIGNMSPDEYGPMIEKLRQYFLSTPLYENLTYDYMDAHFKKSMSEYSKFGYGSNNEYDNWDDDDDDWNDDDINDIFDTFMKFVEKYSRNKTGGGVLFFAIVMMGNLAEELTKKKIISDTRQTYIWRSVLGVSFIGDTGDGIIHPGEESQALFLDKKSYDVIYKGKNPSAIPITNVGKLDTIDKITNAFKLGTLPITYKTLIQLGKLFHEQNKKIPDEILEIIEQNLQFGSDQKNKISPFALEDLVNAEAASQISEEIPDLLVSALQKKVEQGIIQVKIPRAIRIGDMGLIRAAIEYASNTDSFDWDDINSILKTRDPEIIDMLKGHYTIPKTFLYSAIENQDLDLMKLILSTGLKPDKKAMALANMSSNPAVTQLMYKYKDNI